MRVLLVEDHRTMRELIADHLRERGFAVDAVGRGEDALAAAAIAPFDAVILDLGLPDLDGMKVLTLLRCSRPEVPAILLTARDGVDDRLRGLNAGADDYIRKPFSQRLLLERVRAVLRRAEGRGAATAAGAETSGFNSFDEIFDYSLDLDRRGRRRILAGNRIIGNRAEQGRMERRMNLNFS